MNYNDLKTGDILNRHVTFYWYKPNRYISALIRYFTKSWCSHSAMIIDVWGEKMVIENDNSTTRLISYDHWSKDYDIVITRTDLNETEQRNICIMAIQELGYTGYDYEDLVVQIIYSISNTWIGRTGKNAGSKKICSELVAFFYNNLRGYYPEWFKTTPANIYTDNRFKVVFTGKAKDLN